MEQWHTSVFEVRVNNGGIEDFKGLPGIQVLAQRQGG
jgi:hypothetical protein